MEPMKNHRMLENALQILEYVSDHPNGALFNAIVTAMDMPKSSVHGLLKTFVNMGYLEYEAATGLYFIGIKSFETGNKYIENNDYLRHAKDVLEDVSKTCDETAHLGVMQGRDILYLCKFDSLKAVRMVSMVGKRIPLHATALGKALLSGLCDEDIRALYAEHPLVALTKNTVTNLEALLTQIAIVRETGFAYEKEESSPNIECIAVPIKNARGKVFMAMSLSLPMLREKRDFSEYRKILLEGRRQLELTAQ